MEFEDSQAHGLAHGPSDCTAERGVRAVLHHPPRLIDEGANAPVDPPQTQATCGVERDRGVRTLRTDCGTGDGLDGSPRHTTGTRVPVGQRYVLKSFVERNARRWVVYDSHGMAVCDGVYGSEWDAQANADRRNSAGR